MWTPATRKNYSRNGLRYQSDVTDEEWRVIEPYLPPAKGIGRPRGWPLREIVILRHALRLSVAPVAEGPSALEHGLSLVCSLARCLPVREDQPCAGDNGSRAGRARSQSFGTGRLRAFVDSVLPIQQARQAFEQGLQGAFSRKNCLADCRVGWRVTTSAFCAAESRGSKQAMRFYTGR